MRGLELARKYYEECGKDALKEAFPELFTRIAVGLAGEGSECFGFDDEISRDHDWGAAFCIWLDREDYEKYGAEVQKVYESLPEEIEGYHRRNASETAAGRDGVICTQDWYRRYTGCPEGPKTIGEWRRAPEAFLATAVNGEIFHDPSGHFSEIRGRLNAYYPEDVRVKKIAARAAAMAQAGQYNYGRCHQRGEVLAAELAKVEFIKAALSLIHLLNHAYAPFYKWMSRSAKQLKILPRAVTKLEQLVHQDGREAIDGIEAVCMLVTGELRRQELIDPPVMTSDGQQLPVSSFLMDLCPQIMQRIQDPALGNTHFMQE